MYWDTFYSRWRATRSSAMKCLTCPWSASWATSTSWGGCCSWCLESLSIAQRNKVSFVWKLQSWNFKKRVHSAATKLISNVISKYSWCNWQNDHSSKEYARFQSQSNAKFLKEHSSQFFSVDQNGWKSLKCILTKFEFSTVLLAIFKILQFKVVNFSLTSVLPVLWLTFAKLAEFIWKAVNLQFWPFIAEN